MIDVGDTLRIPAGTRLELQDGSVVEVLENPGDGVWLFCRYLSSPDARVELDKEEPVYAADAVRAIED